MTFFSDDFEPPPEPEPRPELPEWIGPPEDVLPAVAATRCVLIRTDDVLATVDQFRVYPRGVTFTLSLMLSKEEHGMWDMPWEMIHRGPQTGVTDDFLRLGVVLSDGRRWSNLDSSPRDFDQQPEGPVLNARGGGGGGRSYSSEFWLWPVPPPPTLTFVVYWPARGVDEQQVTMDVSDFEHLSTTAEAIWPI